MTVATVVVGRSGRREMQRELRLLAEDMTAGNTPMKNRLCTRKVRGFIIKHTVDMKLYTWSESNLYCDIASCDTEESESAILQVVWILEVR